MSKRIVALFAVLSLGSLILVGCQSAKTKLVPPSPYFGINHNDKNYVPEELREDFRNP